MKKRIISLLLTMVMMVTFILPINVFAEEETSHTYDGGGYTVTYDIKSSWTGSQNVEVTVKNTGSEPLLNWALKYDAHGEINGLWNADVYSSDETRYIIKNAGYNYEILPGQSTVFGYTLSGDYMKIPEAMELCSQRTERTEDGCKIELSISEDWGDGFKGEISVENTGDAPLEAWRLIFNTNFKIEEIWNAQIIYSYENSYTIANDVSTTPIGVGETKAFGFKASKSKDIVPGITDIKVSEVTINNDFSTIDIPEFKLAVSGFAKYSEEENALDIFWYTNLENGKFQLSESMDGENFKVINTFDNEYSYKYPIVYDFEKVYFKVEQTTDDGQTAQSPLFYVEKTENGYEAKFPDSDGDGLPDFVEEQIGTVNTECEPDALIHAWYPGSEGGMALAKILFGDISPSGKLPVTFYECSDMLPDFTDYSMKNRTYCYAENNVLYPFGYGLTYGKIVCTSVGYKDGKAVVTAENIGNNSTEDVIQLYIKDYCLSA